MSGPKRDDVDQSRAIFPFSWLKGPLRQGELGHGYCVPTTSFSFFFDTLSNFLPYHSWFLTVVVIWCYYVIILVSSTAHWIGHFGSNTIASIMTIVVIVHLIEIKHVHVKLRDILLPSHQTHQRSIDTKELIQNKY